MPFFILFALGILFIFHFTIYFYFVKVFEIGGTNKLIFSIVIAFLALSFFIARTIAGFDNWFAYAFNYLAYVWFGTAVILFVAIVFSSLLILLVRLTKFDLDIKYIGIATIVITIITVLYGIWNASNIKVTEVDVNIPEIKTLWGDKKVVFLADTHLGSILQKDFLDKLVGIINNEKPDLVLIAGDLFDGPGSKYDYFADSISKLNASDGVYVIEGNHDYYMGEGSLLEMVKGTKYELLANEIVLVDGVQIIGLEYLSKSDEEKIKSIMNSLKENGYDENKPSILMLHEPIMWQYFADFGINLQLAGHTHKNAQIWPGNFITSALYDGKIYGLFTEGKYNIYTTSGAGTWGPPMRIGSHSEIVILNF